MTTLKPWPRDAVMIVASLAGEEIRSHMEGVHKDACRDCGRAVHADTFTVRRAESLPQRHGRPVKFFCLPCHSEYSKVVRAGKDVVEFHDTPEGRAAAAAKMGAES